MSRLLFLALCACTTALHGAELQIDRDGHQRRLSSAQLLADAHTQGITINLDVSYQRPMHYRAIAMKQLLPGLSQDDHLQLIASDGFVAELPAALLLNDKGSQAWLAIEDPAKPWPGLGKAADKASAGPFYLVWQNPEAAQIGPEQWPFRVVAIRQLAPLAQRFKQLLPAADASAAVQAGFAHFSKTCLACHRLNGEGDAQLGPDLNIPYSPTEYFNGDFLARYIRDPQSLRRWPQSKMPAISQAVLSDAQLAELIDYLRHMAGRKVQPQAR
ncbi:cytochrome c [Pseudomonas sp. 5P_3.1_Bac2]|nr:cytochrome c [Pseudomonas sp. 5P_3.1_Bac2]MCU1716222.1 cytochrome c [Pseudomonas sp. 5P_3.1_Bac2]